MQLPRRLDVGHGASRFEGWRCSHNPCSSSDEAVGRSASGSTRESGRTPAAPRPLALDRETTAAPRRTVPTSVCTRPRCSSVSRKPATAVANTVGAAAAPQLSAAVTGGNAQRRVRIGRVARPITGLLGASQPFGLCFFGAWSLSRAWLGKLLGSIRPAWNGSTRCTGAPVKRACCCQRGSTDRNEGGAEAHFIPRHCTPSQGRREPGRASASLLLAGG